MVMPVAQGKIRFVRSSGKIKFSRLWFLCDSGTLLCIAWERKKKKTNITLQSPQAISESEAIDSQFIFSLAIVLCAE